MNMCLYLLPCAQLLTTHLWHSYSPHTYGTATHHTCMDIVIRAATSIHLYVCMCIKTHANGTGVWDSTQAAGCLEGP